ncbi:hypothetical protein FO519_006925 [Halicephalobus sp. NKZ332]|nr:hypothetical protein FO519_006925 [Halicephalobus sp. NKZ332]
MTSSSASIKLSHNIESLEIRIYRLNSAVASLRVRIQRIKDSNNDTFPPNLVSSYVTYLESVRNELRTMMNMVDEGRFFSGFEDVGNMTLDDVEIPKSLLNDGLEVSFIDEQVVEEAEFDSSRPSSVCSSEYFSALEDTQLETESVSSVNDGFFENKVYPEDDLAGEIERDLFEFDQAGLKPDVDEPESNLFDLNGADLKPDAEEPESDLVEVLPRMGLSRFRFDDGYPDSNNSSLSLVSSFAYNDYDQVRTSIVDQSKEKEHIESPPPSPITKENSMDAITAALQAMEIASNRTGEISANNFNELDVVEELVEKNETSDLEINQSTNEDKGSFIPRLVKSDNTGTENMKENTGAFTAKPTPRSPLKPKNEFET